MRDATHDGRRSRGVGAGALAAAAALALLLPPSAVDAQEPTYRSGQSVTPSYEGWVERDDGSRAFLFGYMNRNWEEEPDVPVGEDNHFSPGPDDQGQPTHFQPRRNRFVFQVPVPDDFDAEDDELVWTLTANGETNRAYASLRQDYYVDDVVIMSETGSLGAGSSDPEIRANEPPEVELEVDDEVEARVGEPVTLAVTVADDGVPGADERRPPVNSEGELSLERALSQRTGFITVEKVNGLHFAWFPYRGPRAMTFDPPQTKTWEDTRTFANSPWSFPHWVPPEQPEDDRWVTRVTFHEPGTYVLRGRADDGGLYSDVDVTVTVRSEEPVQ